MRGPKLQVMTSLTSYCNYSIKPSKWQNWREIILTDDNTNLSSHSHTPFEVNVIIKELIEHENQSRLAAGSLFGGHMDELVIAWPHVI